MSTIPKSTDGERSARRSELSSVMRRTVTQRIINTNDVEPKDLKQLTLERRIVMKYLPILFSNDLVHGSWYIYFYSISLPSIYFLNH